MNLINELRMLAEDLYSAGGHNRYAAAMSQAADELASLERYHTAYNEWIDKTEWVQADTSLPAKYLGMHRADVLKDIISELEARCAKWEAVFGHLGDTPDECGNAIIAARDELEATEKELSQALTEARANDRCAMEYLAQVRGIVGGDDFPDMVRRVEALTDALHQISLCSQNSMSSQKECGRIAHSALEGLK